MAQSPFLIPPMTGQPIASEVLSSHAAAMGGPAAAMGGSPHMYGGSPSTLSQHVHAYSHVGKTKSGSNSSSSVGSQNGSSTSVPNPGNTSQGNQGPMLANGANFPGPMQQFPNPLLAAPPLNPLVAGVASGASSAAMHNAAMAAMTAAPLGQFFPLLGNQPAPVEVQGSHPPAGAIPPGQTSNSASSSSFSYPSGGNSGGSNSSDTRTQLSSGESEEDGGGGGEGMTCRRTARREYHKKIERKRRDRMRMLYDKLRSLTEASELADKNGVLEGAIALIQDLKQQNQELLARAALLESAQCSSSSTGDSASTGDSREGSVASSEAERESKRSKTTR